jgi:hypothetical protein
MILKKRTLNPLSFEGYYITFSTAKFCKLETAQTYYTESIFVTCDRAYMEYCYGIEVGIESLFSLN